MVDCLFEVKIKGVRWGHVTCCLPQEVKRVRQSFAFLAKCIGQPLLAAKFTRCGQFVLFLRPNSGFLGVMQLPVKFTWECRRCSNLSDVCLIFCKRHKLVTILLAAEKNTKQSSEHMHSFLLSRSKQPLSHSLIFQIVTNCSSLSSSELSWPSTRSVIHLFCTRC